ncbi:MAG: tyrosine-type recombinase/integrase [Bryobacteraceae bacterium]|nr:tyrosine-type recombinase/integrase [Bryobacteraceae bacterium]
MLRERLSARDEGRLPVILASKDLTFNQLTDWFLERRSTPPYRAEKTHQANLDALKFLRPAFGKFRLTDITPEAIEDYIEVRLTSGRRVHTKLGLEFRGQLKPATVHKEFRVLRRILNVAVKQKRLAVSPCGAVEFPIRLSGATGKPHYMTATEQARIEFFAPEYLRNAMVILVEMGLRPYKELTPMRKDQIDLGNWVAHIPDSKTPNGIADMPMTELAREAFQTQIEATPGTEYLFPTTKKGTKKPHITSFKKVWSATLRRAGIPHFPIYQLRHTFATRLSAGGVADHFVTQMLRQGDSAVFKRYSQAKLNMMREALHRLDRHANEHTDVLGTVKPN